MKDGITTEWLPIAYIAHRQQQLLLFVSDNAVVLSSLSQFQFFGFLAAWISTGYWSVFLRAANVRFQSIRHQSYRRLCHVSQCLVTAAAVRPLWPHPD